MNEDIKKNQILDSTSLERGDALEDAVREAGCRIVIPKPNELQLDIDTEEQFATFLRVYPALQRNEFPEASFIVTESASGFPHRHIVVTLPCEVDMWQRIALQAALGSDPMRELLSALRLFRGDAIPTLLIEPDIEHISDDPFELS